MFYVTTSYCRRCHIRHVGQRVICTECLKSRTDNGEYLLEQAWLATAMYSDMVSQLPEPEAQRWNVVLDHAASIDALPAYQQMAAAVQFRKRLDVTAKTADLFGIMTQLYIQYMERCTDVDLYERLLTTIDHQAAKMFHQLKEKFKRR